MRTFNLTMRIINGFKLDEDLNMIELDDDRYSFTYVEGQDVASQDEIVGDKALIIQLLRDLATRLEDPNWTPITYQNVLKDSEGNVIENLEK